MLRSAGANAMKLTWDVDEQNRVEATFGGLGKNFGKLVVSVNGREVHRAWATRRKAPVAFALSDGRAATLTATHVAFSSPVVDLRVEGELMAPTTKDPVKCRSCGAHAKSNDRFCDGCGRPLPTAETRAHEQRVREATGGMRIISVLFLVFGTIMYFVTKSQDAEALARLAGRDATATLDISGVTYTVADLRQRLNAEPSGVLITNMMLAAVMAGLAVWGKRAPLPAILIATATYAVVMVTNAISDPATIGQGIIVKIVIIAIFARGIKAALALREAKA
jgi:hypothetical protein